MKAPSQGTGPGSRATLTARTRCAARAGLLKLACRPCHVAALHKHSMETTSDTRPCDNLILCSSQHGRLHSKACVSQTLISACPALTVLWLQLLASLAVLSHGHILGCNSKCTTGTQNASFGASSVHASFIVQAHT